MTDLEFTQPEQALIALPSILVAFLPHNSAEKELRKDLCSFQIRWNITLAGCLSDAIQSLDQRQHCNPHLQLSSRHARYRLAFSMKAFSLVCEDASIQLRVRTRTKIRQPVDKISPGPVTFFENQSPCSLSTSPDQNQWLNSFSISCYLFVTRLEIADHARRRKGDSGSTAYIHRSNNDTQCRHGLLCPPLYRKIGAGGYPEAFSHGTYTWHRICRFVAARGSCGPCKFLLLLLPQDRGRNDLSPVFSTVHGMFPKALAQFKRTELGTIDTG